MEPLERELKSKEQDVADSYLEVLKNQAKRIINQGRSFVDLQSRTNPTEGDVKSNASQNYAVQPPSLKRLKNIKNELIRILNHDITHPTKKQLLNHIIEVDRSAFRTELNQLIDGLNEVITLVLNPPESTEVSDKHLSDLPKQSHLDKLKAELHTLRNNHLKHFKVKLDIKQTLLGVWNNSIPFIQKTAELKLNLIPPVHYQQIFEYINSNQIQIDYEEFQFFYLECQFNRIFPVILPTILERMEDPNRHGKLHDIIMDLLPDTWKNMLDGNTYQMITSLMGLRYILSEQQVKELFASHENLERQDKNISALLDNWGLDKISVEQFKSLQDFDTLNIQESRLLQQIAHEHIKKVKRAAKVFLVLYGSEPSDKSKDLLYLDDNYQIESSLGHPSVYGYGINDPDKGRVKTFSLWNKNSSPFGYVESINRQAEFRLFKIAYFNSAERNESIARFSVGNGIKVYRGNELLKSGRSWCFVLGPDDTFYVAKKELRKDGHYVQHSSFLHGEPVRSAGILHINAENRLDGILYSSGHYQPNTPQIQALILYLYKLIGQKVLTITHKYLTDNLIDEYPLNLDQIFNIALLNEEDFKSNAASLEFRENRIYVKSITQEADSKTSDESQTKYLTPTFAFFQLTDNFNLSVFRSDFIHDDLITRNSFPSANDDRIIGTILLLGDAIKSFTFYEDTHKVDPFFKRGRKLLELYVSSLGIDPKYLNYRVKTNDGFKDLTDWIIDNQETDDENELSEDEPEEV